VRRPEPQLSQFGPAIAWLLERDVSSSRLASLFGTSAENIRVVAFRARHVDEHDAETNSPLVERPTPAEAAAVGVRPTLDEVVRTLGRERRLDWLRAQIESTIAQHRQQYTFLEGVRSLRRLAPQIGYAADARRIALRARLHQEMAWFLVHSGQCVSAVEEVRTAQTLWRIAYAESSEREHAERFIQSALIGSHACLLARHPHQAMKTLELARAAAESINAPLGSDHFRQRGVALFQMKEDKRSAEEFQRAAEAMERLSEARIPAQIMMTGARHTNVLGHVNWDGACEILETARQSFGAESLEASMALHWTVAGGLSTDSPAVTQNSLELLSQQPEPGAQFGHQLTIRKLLNITPELGFDLRLIRAWVRRTLYENAFRNR